MIAILCATVLFSIFLSLGYILMFVTSTYFILIPVFTICLLSLKLCYRRPNCKALEIKDFLFTFLVTLIFVLFMWYFLEEDFVIATFTYLYLITFISLLGFVDSIRFKSLM